MFYAAPSTQSPQRSEATSALIADIKHCPLSVGVSSKVIRITSVPPTLQFLGPTRPEREQTRTHVRFGLKVWVAGRIKDGSGFPPEVWTP